MSPVLQLPAHGLRSSPAGARSPWWSPGAQSRVIFFLKVSLRHQPGPPQLPRVPPALAEAECGGEEGMVGSQKGTRGILTLPQ